MNRTNESACKRRDDRLLKYGMLGTAIAALCCFTPALVALVGLIGLSDIVGYLDYVLFPALGFFILLTAWALWRRAQRQST